MSSLPAPLTQMKVKSDPSKDIVHFVDMNKKVVGWWAYDGTWHYPGDGLGYSPTPDASLIISAGPFYGTPQSNLLQLANSVGQIIGWISGNGVPGGTLSSLATSPVQASPVNGVRGWIDGNGQPQGILRSSS